VDERAVQIGFAARSSRFQIVMPIASSSDAAADRRHDASRHDCTAE